MSELLSIREAARRLGVSPDTLREWERAGRLAAERTAGGHRRYSVEAIERLLARRPKTPSKPADAAGPPAQPAPTVARPSGSPFAAALHIGPYWEAQVKDARARVEIKRLRREAIEQQAEIDRRRAHSQREEGAVKRHERQHEQLQALKAFGRSLVPATAGAEVRAEITRDLEEHVTAERYPAELPANDAQVVVQARVGAALALLEKQRAEAAAKEERERRRESDRRQVEWLIASGLRVARGQTRLWETIDQVRALQVVEEQLREEVLSDWSHCQVEALVAEILSEFEEIDEDDEDDENSDPGDDEEQEDDEED